MSPACRQKREDQGYGGEANGPTRQRVATFFSGGSFNSYTVRWSGAEQVLSTGDALESLA
jgi:hypothetical protein